MEKNETSATTYPFTVTYSYNGKTLNLGDLLRGPISNKDINIAAWKAIQFFEAVNVERTAVNA